MNKDNIYNWDNEYSIRIKLKNTDKQVQYIPNNVFMLELPPFDIVDLSSSLTISSDNINDNDFTNDSLILTLRSLKDKSVENEVFNLLVNNKFDIDISFSNPNITDIEFLECYVNKIQYAPLLHRQKSTYYNFNIEIKYNLMKYHIGNDIFTFGNKQIDYMSLATTKENNKRK